MTTHFHARGSGPLAARKAFDHSVGWATLHASHQIQVDTHIEMEAIAGHFRVPKERFAIVPPPLAQHLVGLAQPSRRDFADDPFRLLFVGRLDPQKGLGTILESLALLQAGGDRRYHLRVVGRDYLGVQATYERQAAALRAGSVEFLGVVSDDQLRSLYESSHALVLASRYEAFGIVLIEAMSRGLPIVATKVGGIPAVIEDGVNGLLVPHGDPSALAGAVRLLSTDRSLAERLSAAGPGTAGGYLPPRIADLELDAYRRVLAS
jgi:glycosyltransferase involved in cell wall biosynthesis